MDLEIVEVISLLFGLQGFGVQPNPKAPTADVSLQYAMSEADVVVHVDAVTFVPGNYKILEALPKQPQIKASPELARAVRQMINQVEGARGLAKGATGIDLVTDVTDATLFFQIVPKADPNFVAVVHGKFSPSNLDKIGKMSGKTPAKIGGGVFLDMGMTEPAIAVTKDGAMIAGTPKLIRDRLADGWKAPARPPGSILAHAAEVLGQKPVFSVVMEMSKTARAEAVSKIGGKNFLTDVIQRHRMCAFSVFHDGLGWSWIDATKPGLDAMAMLSDGGIEVMRASHMAPRGMAKMALGALESYKGTDKRIDDLLKNKAELLKIVETFTGDGTFKVTQNKDPKTLRLDVRAQASSLAHVLPAGALVPLAFLGMVTSRGDVPPPPPIQRSSGSGTAPMAAPTPAPAPKAKAATPKK